MWQQICKNVIRICCEDIFGRAGKEGTISQKAEIHGIQTDELFMADLDVVEVACTYPALSNSSSHWLLSHVGIFKHGERAFCLYLRNVQVVLKPQAVIGCLGYMFVAIHCLVLFIPHLLGNN
jgi:hypothetical protein